MKKIMNKYLLLFLCIFSLVLPTGCEIKEQKQVVVDYQEYHFRNEDLLESHYEKHGKEMGFSSSKEYEMSASDVVNNPESLHKTEKEDGDDVYYKENTNEFVVVSTDGIFEPILIQILVRNILIGNDEKKTECQIKI
ncbi:hypothetical protein [Holdemanella biformis]|uniref:DUF4825 domain-containing protein n=1 Tax=Holdemanella biformis TaxID=1735 RepID=A0A412J7P9_9FIRM|nr:hypothetical protein [Holdemanella biformis]RGS48381.1 hypothetical protein DWX92_02800 [Holdemanella biformis]